MPHRSTSRLLLDNWCFHCNFSNIFGLALIHTTGYRLSFSTACGLFHCFWLFSNTACYRLPHRSTSRLLFHNWCFHCNFLHIIFRLTVIHTACNGLPHRSTCGPFLHNSFISNSASYRLSSGALYRLLLDNRCFNCNFFNVVFRVALIHTTGNRLTHRPTTRLRWLCFFRISGGNRLPSSTSSGNLLHN